jgi:hypothetical protein
MECSSRATDYRVSLSDPENRFTLNGGAYTQHGVIIFMFGLAVIIFWKNRIFLTAGDGFKYMRLHRGDTACNPRKGARTAFHSTPDLSASLHLAAINTGTYDETNC